MATAVFHFDAGAPRAGWMRVADHHRRTLAVLAGVALCLFALQPAVSSTLRAQPAEVAATRSEPSGIDAMRVMETVRHHVASDPERAGRLQATDDRYLAQFDRAGFSVRQPDGGPGIRVRLDSASRGGAVTRLDAAPWSGDANVASRGVGDGVTERVTARNGEVEWDVVLSGPPAGTGDLHITADVRGAVPAPSASADHLRWRLPSGATVDMGSLIVKDARGAVLHRALPRVDGAELVLTVPAKVLDGAEYPLTLDPTVGAPKTLSTDLSFQSQTSPAVASDLENGFLVVWDRLNVPNLQGTRVDASGRILDPAGILFGNQGIGKAKPAVAWNGTNYLVTYFEVGEDAAILRGQRIGTDGALVGGQLTLDATLDVPIPERPAAVAPRFGAWNVVYQTGSGAASTVRGVEVEDDGTVASGVLNPTPGDSPVVAGQPGGPQSLVVWRTTSGEIKGIRCCLQGGDPAFVIAAASPSDNENAEPAVAFDGVNYLVTWTHRDPTPNGTGYDVLAQRVSGSAVSPLLGSRIFLSTVTGNQGTSAVSLDVTDFLVVWNDNRTPGNGYDIWGARIARSDGTVKDPNGKLIRAAAGDQLRPKVVSGVDTAIVVWQEGPDNGADVMATRLTNGANWTVLDGNALLVTTGHLAESTDIAFNGTNFLVVWENVRASTSTAQIYGSIVAPNGAVQAGPFALGGTSDQRSPTVASVGGSFAVVWVDRRAGNPDLYGTDVTAAGEVVSPGGNALLNSAAQEIDPALVAASNTYWLAFADNTGGNFNIKLAKPDGLFTIVEAARAEVQPAVAWNSAQNELLVTWSEVRAATGRDIYARRFSIGTSSTVGAAFPVSTAATNQDRPAVTWGSGRFGVTWQDNRNGTLDVYAARITSAGAVEDAAGIPISTGPDQQGVPDVAWNGSSFLVVWQDRRSGFFDVTARTVSAANGALGDAFNIAATGGNESMPAIAAGPGAKVGFSYQATANNDGTVAVFRTSPK